MPRRASSEEHPLNMIQSIISYRFCPTLQQFEHAGKRWKRFHITKTESRDKGSLVVTNRYAVVLLLLQLQMNKSYGISKSLDFFMICNYSIYWVVT